MKHLATSIALLFSLLSFADASAADLPRIRLERFLRLDKPVYLTTDPAGRLFVVEQTGRVLLLGDGKTPNKGAYLDIRKSVFVEYECGLLSIAFHPKFAENGFLYLSYTAKKPNLKSFITELRVDPKADHVDTSTERVVLKLDQPYPNHNGGQIGFGPDGYLYAGFGDGGSQRDPHDHGQRMDVLFGKILRIDVTPREGYAIPKDNPFAGVKDARPEIWALGLRNPWRFSWDPETKVMYAGDVGQDTWEEIDVIERGGNYGWSAREGAHEFKSDAKAPAMIDPVYEYSHNQTAASVTGGYIYRGKAIPALRGWYVFADYSTGRVYGLKYENGKVTASGVLIEPTDPDRNGGQRATQASSFGVDAAGEMYLCDANGPVYRITGQP
jgi:glucose/arabinose dehydrogenase